MSNRKRLLILQNQILNYRIPVYEALNKKYEVTVIHAGSPVESSFQEIILELYMVRSFCMLRNFRRSVDRVNPDYIISMCDFHWPQFILGLPKNTIKNVFWGLDCGSVKIVDELKRRIINVLKFPVLFYSKITEERWKDRISVSTYVATNSVEVAFPRFSDTRSNFINIGSLNSRKRNDLLLHAFAGLSSDIRENAGIVLAGVGEDESMLRAMVIELGIEDSVAFIGYVDDLSTLSEIYGAAVASVSVGQAGLAVSQSVGFGVPFITHKNAITGGEIYGVQDGLTGRLLNCDLDSPECIVELTEVMTAAWSMRSNIEVYKSCRMFYEEKLSIEAMVASFSEVLES